MAISDEEKANECPWMEGSPSKDLAAKMLILRRLNEAHWNRFPEDALHYLAIHSEPNGRTLESHLIRIGAYHALTEKPIDIAMTTRWGHAQPPGLKTSSPPFLP